MAATRPKRKSAAKPAAGYEVAPGRARTLVAGATDRVASGSEVTEATAAARSLDPGAGLIFSRAPRVIVLAGLVPALVIGAAILLRPTQAARTG